MKTAYVSPRYLKELLRRQRNKKATDSMNRAQFRSGGLQGRTGSKYVDSKIEPVPGIHEGEPKGRWMGPRRGSFLGTGGQPAILISHAAGHRVRKIQRLFGSNKTGRFNRTVQRMRAAGELDEVEGRVSVADV